MVGPDRPQIDRRQRPNRWRTDVFNPVPGVPKNLPPGLNSDILDVLAVRIRLEECTQKLMTTQMVILEKTPQPGEVPSPEPEPIYDQHGKRLNTREQRMKDKTADERIQVIERAMAMNPLFRPPADYLSPTSKRSAKLYIPYKEHPEYNFIGLIIGPRGNTQKRMERETGAKIVIRGRGSQKEGKSRLQGNDDDELHVLVTADTQDALDRACEMVRQLLVPVDEGKNEHKRAQLRELAEINGTLRDQVWESTGGHDWNPANVECAICGDRSHVTQDCPLKGTGAKDQRLESEFDAFLSEIGEAPPPSEAPLPTAADDAYAEFQKAIGGGGGDAPPPSGGPPPGQGYPPQAMQGMPPYGGWPGQMPPGQMPGQMPPQGMPPMGWPGQMPPQGMMGGMPPMGYPPQQQQQQQWQQPPPRQ